MLSDDGGLLACALCAASAALVDAAVPLARTFGKTLFIWIFGTSL